MLTSLEFRVSGFAQKVLRDEPAERLIGCRVPETSANGAHNPGMKRVLRELSGFFD
jgi:hypothetical protein